MAQDNNCNNEKKNDNTKEGLTWLPLSGGLTKQQKKDLEKEFGYIWRDLFNGL